MANESYIRFGDDDKQSTHNLTILREMGKMNTHNPIYYMKSNGY